MASFIRKYDIYMDIWSNGEVFLKFNLWPDWIIVATSCFDLDVWPAYNVSRDVFGGVIMRKGGLE